MAQINVSKALLTELKQTRELLLKSGSLPARSCHAARKHIKRARSYLRLYEPHLEKGVYQRLNVTLRNAGQRLSEARDASARKSTRNILTNRLQEELPYKEKQVSLPLSSRKRHAQNISECIFEIHNWPFPKAEKRFFEQGHQATFQKGRYALKRALRSKKSEDFHEWRKQEKHFLYQSQLLGSLKKGQLFRYKSLSDLLGKDHDLCVFGDYWSSKVNGTVQKHLKRELSKRVKKLRAKEMKLGRQLYG